MTAAVKSAKNMIRAIKQTISRKTGEDVTRAAVAKLVGASETSIKNWETGRYDDVSEESLQKLEEALAKAESEGGEVQGIKHVRGSLGGALGDLAEAPEVEAVVARADRSRKFGTPIWNNMKIPNQKAEEAKLKKFIATVGIKPLCPATGVLCDDGTVYWMFVAEFPAKAMQHIVKKLNEHNRQVGAERGKQYALDMQSGNWGWTGEPILFSAKGDLLNGQNRMLAGRAYGKPLVFAVGFGLSPEAIRFMDRQMVRSNRHQGQAEGWTYNFIRSLTLGLIHRYEKSKGGEIDYLQKVAPGGTKVGGARHEELNSRYREELDPALEFVHGLRWGIGRTALPKHIGVFMFMLMARKSPEAARYFMLALADGTHAMPNTPAYALRFRLTKLVSDRKVEPGRHEKMLKDQIGEVGSDAQVSRSTEALIIRTIAAAWNSFCAGKKNASGNFRTNVDKSVTTTALISDLGKPCPRALEESKAFTDEALEAVLARARAVRASDEKKAYNQNRDEGDTKHAAIKKTLETA